jgi:hypothetical protein
VNNEITDVLNALASIGPAGDGVLEALLARLPEDKGNIYQPWGNPVALAFKKFGPTAVPALLRLFREGKTDQERRCAVVALGYIGPGAKQAVPDLEAVLKRLKDRDDKTEAERWMQNTLEPALRSIRKASGSVEKMK